MCKPYSPSNSANFNSCPLDSNPTAAARCLLLQKNVRTSLQVFHFDPFSNQTESIQLPRLMSRHLDHLCHLAACLPKHALPGTGGGVHCVPSPDGQPHRDLRRPVDWRRHLGPCRCPDLRCCSAFRRCLEPHLRCPWQRCRLTSLCDGCHWQCSYSLRCPNRDCSYEGNFCK
jgi:hypothetical protein